MRIKELEDALEAEREARMRVCIIITPSCFVIFFAIQSGMHQDHISFNTLSKWNSQQMLITDKQNSLIGLFGSLLFINHKMYIPISFTLYLSIQWVQYILAAAGTIQI